MNLYKVKIGYEETGICLLSHIKFTDYELRQLNEFNPVYSSLLRKGFYEVSSPTYSDTILIIDMNFNISDDNGNKNLSYTEAMEIQSQLRTLLRNESINNILE